MVEGRASGAALSLLPGKPAKALGQGWMLRGGWLKRTEKHCIESPKEKTLCLGVQLAHRGLMHLDGGRLLHPQHFLKH